MVSFLQCWYLPCYLRQFGIFHELHFKNGDFIKPKHTLPTALRFEIFWFSGVWKGGNPTRPAWISLPFIWKNSKMENQSFLLLHFKNLSSVVPGLPYSSLFFFPTNSAVSPPGWKNLRPRSIVTCSQQKKKDNLTFAASCSMKCLFNYGDSTSVAFPL